jgi:fermentation-respiration switch protein FrsA (DUF1100 family)
MMSYLPWRHAPVCIAPRRWSAVVAAWALWSLLAGAPGCSQDAMVFDRPAPVPTRPSRFAQHAIRFQVPLGPASAGSSSFVEAWFIPALGATAVHPAPVIVFCHGNHQIIDEIDDHVAGYLALGCSVLLPEYRGYGRSGGDPSQDAIGHDTTLFYDLMAARPEVDPARIVFHGYSLGGAVAADLARRRKPAALILESTFTRTAYFPLSHGMPPFLEFMVRNPFRTDEVVTQLDRPILILHGRTDEIVGVDQGRKLHQLAKDATYVELDGGHHLLDGGMRDNYWAKIKSFLQEHAILNVP